MVYTYTRFPSKSCHYENALFKRKKKKKKSKARDFLTKHAQTGVKARSIPPSSAQLSISISTCLYVYIYIYTCLLFHRKRGRVENLKCRTFYTRVGKGESLLVAQTLPREKNVQRNSSGGGRERDRDRKREREITSEEKVLAYTYLQVTHTLVSRLSTNSPRATGTLTTIKARTESASNVATNGRWDPYRAYTNVVPRKQRG